MNFLCTRRPPAVFCSMAILILSALPAGPARSEKMQMTHGERGQTAQAGCALGVALSEDAERKPGGALFKKPAEAHHGHSKGTMEHMKGAHMRHQPRHGGAFYMATTQMHHLEIIYSDACGFSVVFYNAFTEAIRADRFQAFLKAVPDDESEAELVRILAPAHGATMLYAPLGRMLGQTLDRPFQIRLHVKFPGTVEPQLFTTRIE